MEKRYCEYCGKCLQKIGANRKNGKGNYKDWANRPYHKKCFKIISEPKSNIYSMNYDYYDNDNKKLKEDLNNHKLRLQKIKENHEKARNEKKK